MQLSIPETIIQSIRLPENRIEAELLKELALALYAQELREQTGILNQPKPGQQALPPTEHNHQ